MSAVQLSQKARPPHSINPVRVLVSDAGQIEDVRDVVEATLAKLAPVIVEMARARHLTIRTELVNAFLQGAAPRPVDMALARLQARAHRQIFDATEWLTASEIADLANLGLGNPAATVNRWKQQGKIFAISRDGKDYFPRYCLGPDFRPLAHILGVTAVFGDRTADQLAAWFESTSGYLGGKRPRELLATHPDRVLAAARDATQSEQAAG